jgi:arylsulfatase A-like enzyme
MDDHDENGTHTAHPRAHLPVQARRPNVLLVVSDQERGWELYPDGFVDRHLPARAWLRNHGVELTRYITPTPICSTSRGVIYTGAHSMTNGVWENTPIPYASPLGRNVPTLGTLFQDAGYVTGYAGKWHMSAMKEHTDDAEAREVQRTLRSYGFMDTANTHEVDGALVGWQHDAATVEQSLAFVQRHHGGDRPWFLAVNLLNPHDIMYFTSGDEMTASRASSFPDRSERPPFDDPLYAQDLGYELTESYGAERFDDRPAAVREYHLTISESMGYLDYGDHAAGREMQNYYWNCTRDSDRHLSTLLDGLRTMRALDDTVIVFTSDHGEMLGAHGMRGKGTYAARETTRVPFVVVHPNAPHGAQSDALASHVDLAPTMMALAGVDVTDLASQLPTLVGHDVSASVFEPTRQTSRNALLLHWTNIVFQDHRSVRGFDAVRKMDPEQRLPAVLELMRAAMANRGQMRGVADGRWKFQRYCAPYELSQPATFDELLATHDIELYDTLDDPAETTNLATNATAWRSEIEQLNGLTNSLIAREVGVDDGAYLPRF